MRRSFLSRFNPFRTDHNDPIGGGSDSENSTRTFPDRCSCSKRSVSSAKQHSLGPLTVYRHRAMACDFEISINEVDSPAENALDVFDIVDREEDSLSVFRATSVVSRINSLASEMNVSVPSKIFDRLLICRSLWEETEGAFDITSSPLWKLWGFAKGEGRVPSNSEIDKALEKIGMQHVILNEDDQTVAFDLPGVEINFGAIGKGFALDDAATFLTKTSLENYLIHGGMSSILCRGGRAGDKILDSNGSLRPCWSIGIADPIEPERRLATLCLTDDAVGTAGSGRQYFFHRGKRLSHIINPKTGCPAVGILSVTVVTNDPARADALSTAFFVMGVEKTDKFVRKHPDCHVLFVIETRYGDREIVTLNMDDSLYRPE